MALPRPSFICASCARTLRDRSTPKVLGSRALLSRTSTRAASASQAPQLRERADVPRWRQTPPAMRMPVRLRKQTSWEVNDDPKALDAALDRFVGDAGRGMRGSEMLTEEVKWLSVTHKSFEQGAQGFNDKLAFLGKRILDLQLSKALIRSPVSSEHLVSVQETISGEERIGPTVKHPALKGVENISVLAKDTVLTSARLASLAQRYDLPSVVRWLPRMTENLSSSGAEAIMAHSTYAIIGAIALQQGGQVANDVARQRVLKPLGLSVKNV